jgi:hypothetical protein
VNSTNWTCKTRKLGAGQSSPLTGEFADVDAITFPSRKFEVNGRNYAKGQFVKIPNWSAVRCWNIKVPGWDSVPRCAAP